VIRLQVKWGAVSEANSKGRRSQRLFRRKVYTLLLAFRIVDRTKFITAIEMKRNDSRRQDATKAIECSKFAVAFSLLIYLLWNFVLSSSALGESAGWNLHHALREMTFMPNNVDSPSFEGRDAGRWSLKGYVVDASRWMLILACDAVLRYPESIRTDSAEQPPRTAPRYRHRYSTIIRGACIIGGDFATAQFSFSVMMLFPPQSREDEVERGKRAVPGRRLRLFSPLV
jgi:hypothetical protein